MRRSYRNLRPVREELPKRCYNTLTVCVFNITQVSDFKYYTSEMMEILKLLANSVLTKDFFIVNICALKRFVKWVHDMWELLHKRYSCI